MSLPMLFVLIAGASALMGFYRLLAGPTATDRVVGLDILFAVAIILSLTASWVSGRTVYLDVAIGLALVSSVATLSWARLIQVGAQGDGLVGTQGGAVGGGQDGSQRRSQGDGREVGWGDAKRDSRRDTRADSRGKSQDGGSGDRRGDIWGHSQGSGQKQEVRS